MRVAIADSLPESAAHLEGTDGKRLWAFITKLQESGDSGSDSLQLERVTGACDTNVWSGRVSQDLRAIMYHEGDAWIVLHADRHDPAYAWAKAWRGRRHPVTGAIQVVEPPEPAIEQIRKRRESGPGTFEAWDDAYLLSLGLPVDWLPAIREVRSDEALDVVLASLPEEVAERLLALALGEFVAPPTPLTPDAPTIDSEDTKRRVVMVKDAEELQRILDAPLAKWVAFLHPDQRKWAYGTFDGPIKITGAAGTGKTVVALHRARYLARQGKRVLLTSFVKTLCKNLDHQLRLICTEEEHELITVSWVHQQANEIVKRSPNPISPIHSTEIDAYLEELLKVRECPFNRVSLQAEWKDVVQAGEITTWTKYRSADRSGRGFPLTIKQRRQVWDLFVELRDWLASNKRVDWSGLCVVARQAIESGACKSPYDAVIVDELQDLGVQEIKLLAALAGDGPDRLMLVGDAGQRIYSGGFTLSGLGIDVSGRSHVLRVNYRTTEQIRDLADIIVGDPVDDMDGGEVWRRGTLSILTGEDPVLRGFNTKEQQTAFVVEAITREIEEGRSPEDIAVFARSENRVKVIEGALTDIGVCVFSLKDEHEPAVPCVHLGTMHRAKGLEFKVVFVVDASAEVLPTEKALEGIMDDAVREATLALERQLFYVSLTRARDKVYVTWVGKPTPFLTIGGAKGRADD